MSFYFSAYSTPLLFGFVQGWVYAVLLWMRGRRDERLSDSLLGWVLVGMGFNIWEYMLGFGGIEILWKELDFFPRTFGPLFPVLCYFYLRAQVNADFRFGWRDLRHAVPFLLFVTYHVAIFAQGPEFVRWWQETYHYNDGIATVEYIVFTAITYYYLYRSFRLYRDYRAWTKTQFSDTDVVSFRWFRNFLIAFLFAETFSLVMTVTDFIFDLDYQQDWWDELLGAVMIYYVSITGYSQAQYRQRLTFRGAEEPAPWSVSAPATSSPSSVSSPTTPEAQPVGDDTGYGTKSATPDLKPASLPPDLSNWRDKLLAYMSAEKPYLEPELSLTDLARRLKTNPSVLSQVINAGVGKNFNDFVNEYRVEEFKRQVQQPANRHLSLLGLALDCGFNSKATFNRAFKKFAGVSPKEFLDSATALSPATPVSA